MGSFAVFFFFFSSRRRHTRYWRDWSSDVCSSDLPELVGWGGFKGPPTRETVEIGYEIAESRQGRGLATAAARAMVEDAFADERVTRVIAHTLPEHNASTRVLEKLGFRLDGEAEENGRRVWRFALARNERLARVDARGVLANRRSKEERRGGDQHPSRDPERHGGGEPGEGRSDEHGARRGRARQHETGADERKDEHPDGEHSSDAGDGEQGVG